MYVVLLDLHESRTQAQFLAAIIAKVSGNVDGDVEVPNPIAEREEWELWLKSKPEFKQRPKDQAILYEALFPKNRGR